MDQFSYRYPKCPIFVAVEMLIEISRMANHEPHLSFSVDKTCMYNKCAWFDNERGCCGVLPHDYQKLIFEKMMTEEEQPSEEE